MTRLIPLALLLLACGQPDDSQTGFTTTQGSGTGSGGSCEVVVDEEIAPDEVAGDPLNFSAENALAEVTGVSNTTGVYTYPDEMTINLEVEFMWDGGPTRFVERDAVGALSPQDLARCFTAIQIPGDLTFVTGDGVFDEAFSGVVAEAKKRRETVFRIEVAQADLNGSWTPADSGLDPNLTGLTLVFEGDITNLGSSGVVTATDGSTTYDVGTWDPPPTQGR